MKEIFLYLDDFNIISNEVMKNLNYLKKLKSENPSIKKIIILIRQEKLDIFTPSERKYFLEKVLDDSNFIIKSTNLEKIFKIIKKIEGQNIKIKKIFVNEVDKNYIENGLKGLPIEVFSFKNYESVNDEIIQFIKNNEYQNFVQSVPTAMYDEFEWLKEKLNQKLEENILQTIIQLIDGD